MTPPHSSQPGHSSQPEPSADEVELAGHFMQRQAGLGLGVAAIFLLLVFGVPLLNHYVPDWTQPVLFGFPLSWFILGLAFYPITWALSFYFVRASERMEAEDADVARRQLGERAGRGLR